MNVDGEKPRTTSRNERISSRPAIIDHLLQPADQKTLMHILALCAVGICSYVIIFAVRADGLVSFDDAQPQKVEFQVDINTAPWTEIALLPNIGETIARAIVDFRVKNGPIEDIDSLAQISGISDKKISQLKRYTVALEPTAELLVDRNRP